jgi:hypothetical protein
MAVRRGIIAVEAIQKLTFLLEGVSGLTVE